MWGPLMGMTAPYFRPHCPLPSSVDTIFWLMVGHLTDWASPPPPQLWTELELFVQWMGGEDSV